MSLNTPSRRCLLNACVLFGYAAALSPGHAQTKAPVQVVTKANVDDALASAPKPAAPYHDPFAELAE